MTQQSLIARLKAVEDALVAAQEVFSLAEVDHPDEAFADFSESTLIPALSDLRALIKEAENLECYGVITSENAVEYSAFYPQACHDHINEMLMCDFPDEDAKNWVVRRLFFDALGESHDQANG